MEQVITNPNKQQNPAPSLWDGFEHLLMFISLLIMTFSLTLSIHFFIDKWLPNNAVENYGFNYVYSWQLTLLRVYTAALLVSTPIFMFLFLRVTKKTINNPELRNLIIRKILIYLALVITFLIMIGNLISLIFSFLNGNATINFLIHFLVTILINSVIFAYYLHEIREDMKIHA